MLEWNEYKGEMNASLNPSQ